MISNFKALKTHLARIARRSLLSKAEFAADAPVRGLFSLWAPWAFCGGAAAYFFPLNEPATWLPFIVIVLGFLAAVALYRRASERNVWLALSLGLLVAFAAGWGAAQYRTHIREAPKLRAQSTVYKGTGIVLAVDNERGHRARYLIAPKTLGRLQAAQLPARIRMSSFLGDAEPGDFVGFTGALQAPQEAQFPGAYNFARSAWFDQIGGSGFSYGHLRQIETAEPLHHGLHLLLVQKRRALALHIRNGLAGQKGAVAAALVTGDRSAISEATAEGLRAAGLAHMLAISGLHMGLVAGFVFISAAMVLAAIPAIGRRFDARKPAAILGLAAAISYLMLSGASAPTQRAFVMTIVVFIAVLMNRRALSLRTISLAAFMVVVLAPENVISPGFQMSFSAVLALIAFYEWNRRRTHLRARGQDWGKFNIVLRFFTIMLALAMTSLIAGFATGPAAAFYFNRTATYGLVANLAAMPVFTFVVMPSLLIGTLLETVQAGGPFFMLAGWGLETIIKIAYTVGAFSKALIHMPAVSPLVYTLIVVGLLLLCFLKGKKRFIGVAAIAMGVFSWSQVNVPDGVLLPNGGALMVEIDGNKKVLGFGEISSFELEQFTSSLGIAQEHAISMKKSAKILPCDNNGCLVHIADGRRVAVVLRVDQLAEDCRLADIVLFAQKITPRNLANCAPEKLIYPGMHEGQVALLYLDERKKIKPLSMAKRPWSN